MVAHARQGVLGHEVAFVSRLLQPGEELPVIDWAAHRRRRPLFDRAIPFGEVPRPEVRQQDVAAAGADGFADILVALALVEERRVESSPTFAQSTSRIIASVSS